MNILTEYYFIIIIIGLFITFSLIGYLVELIKNNKEHQKEVKETNFFELEKLEDIKIENKKEETEETIKNVNLDKKDDLLEDYNNDI